MSCYEILTKEGDDGVAERKRSVIADNASRAFDQGTNMGLVSPDGPAGLASEGLAAQDAFDTHLLTPPLGSVGRIDPNTISQRVGRKLRKQPARLQNADVLDKPLDLRHRMRRQKQGRACLSAMFGEQAENVLSRDGIKAVGGLVQKQKWWAMRERAQQLETPRLAL